MDCYFVCQKSAVNEQNVKGKKNGPDSKNKETVDAFAIGNKNHRKPLYFLCHILAHIYVT